MERSDSTIIQVAELTNKRSICRAHLKGYEIKTLHSTTGELMKEILDEEQLQKDKKENHVENCIN